MLVSPGSLTKSLTPQIALTVDAAFANPIVKGSLATAGLFDSGADISLLNRGAAKKLQEWISVSPDTRAEDLQALRLEIKTVLNNDDYQRQALGRAESKIKLLDFGYFFNENRLSKAIPSIEKEWISTLLAVAVSTLADPAPKLETLHELDSVIRTFNKSYQQSGWNFSLILLEQLCLNRFEIGDSLRAALRLSGQGTKQPGEFGYRMAAMTLFLLGMHVKSSLPNELHYDLRPMKSLALATEVLREPSSLHFLESVPPHLQPELRENLRAGLLIFLYSSSKFWNQQNPEVEPLQQYLLSNVDIIDPLIAEAVSGSERLSSVFVHAGSFWLHSNIFKTRSLPANPPGSWDEIFLNPHKDENIYWYRVVLGGYIPAFLFQAHQSSPDVFLKKNSEAYAQFALNWSNFKAKFA
jgi:hypothetical protein